VPLDFNTLGIYRIIPIQNLEHDLQNGLFSKKNCIISPTYKRIGSKEVISRRDTVIVKCYPDTVVNDYVPFYFSTRTPMLYNIITGNGVPAFPQKEIIYLCCKVIDLAKDQFQWCYTDGNAAMRITNFFTDLEGIETNIDWHSIKTTDFRTNNADGDVDRIRKKHSEFLIKDYVPSSLIKSIVVLNEVKKKEVEAILIKLKLRINVIINTNNNYYF
jgi:hypothetical protein